MQQLKTKQKNFFSNYIYLYTILLILTLLSINLVDNIERNSLGLIITTLLLSVNLFFFIKVRRSKDSFNGEKIYSLFTTTMALWFFLHCLLFIKPIYGESISTILTIIGFDVKGILNYKTVSFFTANLFCLIVSITEIKNSKTYKPIYLFGVILTFVFLCYYVINHTVLIIK